jgi:hypothetical protein
MVKQLEEVPPGPEVRLDEEELSAEEAASFDWLSPGFRGRFSKQDRHVSITTLLKSAHHINT